MTINAEIIKTEKIIEQFYIKLDQIIKDEKEKEIIELFKLVRYYELIIVEIKNKEYYHDETLVKQSIIEIRKHLNQSLMSLI